MNTNKSQNINGKYLYYAFISGGKEIINNQISLNDINVFPVRDKDTGSNLASTIRSVINNTIPNKSYKETVGLIANAALEGARGNSGVIFAQFLYGLSCETIDKASINISDFTDSVKRSIPYLYNAISNPVEGTMLTVIKDWSDYLNSQKNIINDFKDLFITSLSILEKSLSETTSKLKELGKYGVVDAGAKGFVVFIKGIADFLSDTNVRDLLESVNKKNNIPQHENHFKADEDIKYRYCAEAKMQDVFVKFYRLKEILEEYGNSSLIAGSNEMCSVHVHTNKPADLFKELQKVGYIVSQKVEDIKHQQDIVNHRKWNIAIVTDSTCDLSQELIDEYQINVLPMNINFGDDSYLDKLTINPKQFYDLLEKDVDFPQSSQINEASFTSLYSQLSNHYDEIIAIHLSSKFSGTYANSKKAGEKISKELGTRIEVIDSKNLSGGLGLLVYKTAKDIEAGDNLDKILDSLHREIKMTRIYVSVKDMKSMIRGGRVSRPRGFIANSIGINPIVSMNLKGDSLLYGVSFGQKNSLKKIEQQIRKAQKHHKIWNYIILHAHNELGAEKAKHDMEEISGKEPVSVVDISPVIGMHAGQGAVSISLMYN